MSEEGFLQAIAEAPEDDTPRLVYADWLEEHGQPERAEFIRLQCELARVEEDEVHPAQEDRVRELEKAHREEWLADLPAPEGVHWGFHRGLPEELRVGTFTVLRKRAKTLFRAPVRRLQVQKWRHVGALAGLPQLAGLTRLDLSFHTVSPAGAYALASSPYLANLTELVLQDVKLRDEGLKALAAWGHPGRLRLLDVSFNPLREAGARALGASSSLAGLRTLQIGNTEIGPEGVEALAALQALENLTDLGVDSLDMGDAGAFALAGSPWLKRLARLDLSQSDLTPEGVRALARSPNLAGLTAVTFWSDGFGDEGLEAMADSPTWERLAHLKLGHVEGITGKGVAALARCRAFARLEVFEVLRPRLGLEGARALARRGVWPHLWKLRVYGAGLGEEGAEAFAAGSPFPRLEDLDLSGNEIGDRGAKALASCRHWRHLRELDLGDNALGDAGTAALAASPLLAPLTDLDLTENAATLNNSSLAYFALYQLTHEREHFTRGLDRLDRALALKPTDSILLRNAVAAVLENALQDVIGPGVSWKVLKRGSGLDVLPFLYGDQAGRRKYEERVRNHPGVIKARSYLEKLMVLAPKGAGGYSEMAALCAYTHDLDGLRDVWARLGKVELDLADARRESLEFYAGKKDAKRLTDLKNALARQDQVVAAARKVKGVTFAVAGVGLVYLRISAASRGQEPDASALVGLAEQAHKAAPSDATRSALVSALLFRAHQALSKEDKAYAERAARTRRSLGMTLLNYVLAEGASWRRRRGPTPTSSGPWRSSSSRARPCPTSGARGAGRCCAGRTRRRRPRSRRRSRPTSGGR
jgi:uncharacterized protein (TIGR02996 family)